MRSRLLKSFILAVIALLIAAAGAAYHLRPRTLDLTVSSPLPQIDFNQGRWEVRLQHGALVASVAEFTSEMQAFLYFQYLQSHAGLARGDVLLSVAPGDPSPTYRVDLVMGNDLLDAVPHLLRLKDQGFIHDFNLQSCAAPDLAYQRIRSDVFVDAYSPFVAPALESLPPAQLLDPVARFLLFKSETDRRVRENIEPVPQTLSYSEARSLASDILAVSRFYQLPLDVFLGIGAMENNYMDVRGDLGHAIWKRRPQKGDIVLKRAHGRVLVCDYAMGRWQITRETLRFAHRLFLQDKRDYSALPERLRPSKTLALSYELEHPEVLTTYAGLLLRYLIDRTQGNVETAVGAYNGSLHTPNYEYASGVSAVAQYARNFLERAANLGGLNVAAIWSSSPPPTVRNQPTLADGSTKSPEATLSPLRPAAAPASSRAGFTTVAPISSAAEFPQ